MRDLPQKGPALDLSVDAANSTDADLVRKCRSGDQAAWDRLIDRFQRLIYAIPRRAGLSDEQCSDVFQEVVLTLFERLDTIEDPSRIRAWLVTTAKFKTWAAVRSDRGVRSVSTDEEMELELERIEDHSKLPDEALVELEQQHIVRSAVMDLDPRCREIISMLYLREDPATYADVARHIDVGETSISPLRARCLKKLAKILQK